MWGLAIVVCLAVIWAPLVVRYVKGLKKAEVKPDTPLPPKVFVERTHYVSGIKDEWEETFRQRATPTTTPTTTVEFFEEQSATDMPIEDFNAIFEQNRIIIERETFGYTTDWNKWTQSKAAHYSSKHGTIPEFDLLAHFGSFATEESFMLDGKVYAMDIREPKMFSSVEDLLEYTKTLFAVYLVYAGVSPIDRTTKRYFIVGCKEEDGVVPTHGL